MPTDIAHIRHVNFMALYRQFRDEHPDLPERGMLKMFAARVGVSDRYLSHIKCNRKNIGANLARTIEQSLGLEHGWIDREHAEDGMLLEEGDAAELMFLETARMLYRSEPDEARKTLMALLRKKLLPVA